MAYILTTLAPVFGLILLGYLARRSDRIGTTAAAELNRFVVWLCLPSLLFTATATARVEEIWHPGFVLVFTATTLAVFAGTLVWRLTRGKALAEAGLDALSASYANTGYVGIPLCIFVLGEAGLEPALVASLVVVSLLFAIAVICVEIGLQNGTGLLRSTTGVLQALLKNPLIISPLLGIAWNAAGSGIPQVMHALLKLLGDATIPCALVSLGAFLAQKQSADGRGWLPLVSIKLLLHPLLTWLLAYHVFQLPPLWAKAAVLLSALPTGTGPYMLAEFYRHDAAVVSRTILISTAGSVITLSLCLLLLP